MNPLGNIITAVQGFPDDVAGAQQELLTLLSFFRANLEGRKPTAYTVIDGAISIIKADFNSRSLKANGY